ncbi:MAG: alpha/beta fold hydrolase [Myxococcaceae bacterium]
MPGRRGTHLVAAAVLLLLTGLAGAVEPAGRLIDGPAGKLYVEFHGTAPGRPLLIVNGGPGFDHGYLLLSPVWDEIAKGRRVVMYDQRGTGRSTPVKPGTPLTLADQLADLEAIRKNLGAQEVDLLGHSYGGALVMAYTARFPDRVKRLLIVDSAAPKWSETVFLFSQVYPDVSEHMDGFELGAQFNDTAAIEAQIRDYLSMIFWDPDHRDAFLRQYSPGSFRRHVNQALDADMGKYDLNPEIKKFRLPVLVITGRYDMNVAPVVAWKIHKAIPGSQLVIFERSGHLPFYEEPERFRKVLEDFLGKP